MKIDIKPGKYVLAVSGGVDSMALLDILAQKRSVKIIVAHFNHGIREDAELDEKLVADVATNRGLKLEIGRAKLGPGASEEAARKVRYKFLSKVKISHQANGIITAHHQDDLIETALLNLLRGSGRRGLTAISDSEIIRPLLLTPKSEIVEYANSNNLRWREDSTNTDSKYLRNRLRNALSRVDPVIKAQVIKSIQDLVILNQIIDKEIATFSRQLMKKGEINRSEFSQLPQVVNNELVVFWLRSLGLLDFDKKTITRLSTVLKTAAPDTKHAVMSDYVLKINRKSARFATSV